MLRWPIFFKRNIVYEISSKNRHVDISLRTEYVTSFWGYSNNCINMENIKYQKLSEELFQPSSAGQGCKSGEIHPPIV